MVRSRRLSCLRTTMECMLWFSIRVSTQVHADLSFPIFTCIHHYHEQSFEFYYSVLCLHVWFLLHKLLVHIIKRLSHSVTFPRSFGQNRVIFLPFFGPYYRNLVVVHVLSDVITAATAKLYLEGHCIYDGGYCKLHLSYSRHTNLTIMVQILVSVLQ